VFSAAHSCAICRVKRSMNSMFTEAVDNFVDNLGLLGATAVQYLLLSELPSGWAS